MTDKKLYLYQEQAAGLLEENVRNLLIVAPTGAGKTWVGFKALEQAGSGCYIAPTRALCHEKLMWLRDQFPDARVVIGNKDYTLRGSDFARADYRVITPWRLNMMVQSRTDLDALSPVFVLDELQDLSREPDIELVLTKLLAIHDDNIRLVGLSAAMREDDAPKVAAWLNAQTIESDVRPVPLEEHVVHFSPDLTDWDEEVTDMTIWEQGRQTDSFLLDRALEGHGKYDAVVETARHIRITQDDDAPVMVFTPYQMRAQHLANHLHTLQQQLQVEPVAELEQLARELTSGAGEFTEVLKRVLPYRIGMHHGGMTQAERELVERLMLEGRLDFCVTCLTLAHGVNFPFRHLIIESVYDHDNTGQRRLMDISLFRNLIGRTGRPQFDKIGHVWIPVLTEIEKTEVEEVLLKHKASRIVSRVYNTYFLTAQVPGLIQLGFNTAEKLADFMKRTLWGMAQRDLTPLVSQFEQIITDLVDYGVVQIVGPLLVLTDKGHRIARLGLHPGEYEAMTALIGQENADYNTWVGNLARACREYVIPDMDDETAAAVINEVTTYGLATYAIKPSHHKARDLADYVGRLIEITKVLMGIDPPAGGYAEEWREEVFDRYAYGHLELARLLAPALTRSELRRLVRNLGMALAAPTIHEFDEYDFYDYEFDEEELLGESTLAMMREGGNGAAPPPAKEPKPTIHVPEATLVAIVSHLWHFKRDVPLWKVEKIAEVLGIDVQHIWDTIETAKSRGSRVMEVA